MIKYEDAVLIVNNLFKYIDQNDWENLACMFHDEIEYERPGYPDVMPLKGKAKVMNYFKNIRKVPMGTHTANKVFVNDDCIICTGGFSGLSKTNQSVTSRFADYYQLKDGLIINRVSYFV